MSIEDSITQKLEYSSRRVDQFINVVLRPRRPEQIYEAARHLIVAGGKRLRPYMVLKSCELLGGDPNTAVPYAAAMEILHNFTLVHDDVMDNDPLRRGVPTVHAKWNVPLAIACGDLLFAKVYEAAMREKVSSIPCEKILACIERITDASIAICEGQVLDISFPSISHVTESDYLAMVRGKTAALFKACAEVGAIVGGGEKEEVELLGDYAFNAGISFQIIDDYLGVTADEKTLGKPVGSDFREGKKTLIIIHALENASPSENERITKVLGNAHADRKDVEAVLRILGETGSLAHAKQKAKTYANKSKNTLKKFPDSDSRRDLIELVDYFLTRIR